MAEVANTCPLEPTAITTIEATTTIRSKMFGSLSNGLFDFILYHYFPTDH